MILQSFWVDTEFAGLFTYKHVYIDMIICICMIYLFTCLHRAVRVGSVEGPPSLHCGCRDAGENFGSTLNIFSMFSVSQRVHVDFSQSSLYKCQNY